MTMGQTCQGEHTPTCRMVQLLLQEPERVYRKHWRAVRAAPHIVYAVLLHEPQHLHVLIELVLQRKCTQDAQCWECMCETCAPP